MRGRGRAVGAAGSRGTEGECVGLAAFRHRRLGCGIEEDIRVIGGILRLYEAVELCVLRCLLAEDRVTVGRWIRREILYEA